MRYILDTDTRIWVLRGWEPVYSWIRGRSPDDLAVASMTEAELRRGALRSREPARNLALVEALMAAPLAVLPFGREAARVYADLRLRLGRWAIGERDFIIAIVAVAHGLAVVTGNVREFARVPGLEVGGWVEG